MSWIGTNAHASKLKRDLPWITDLNLIKLKKRTYYKEDRSAHWKFWKEPLKSTKILFYGHSLKYFSPLRGSNSETTQLTLAFIYFCSRLYLRGSTKTPTVDLLELNTIRGAVNVERSESSTILSKSLGSSFIRKTSSFRSEITSTSFGKACSILRVKVKRVLSFSRKRRLKNSAES